jgi:hypothetical protein
MKYERTSLPKREGELLIEEVQPWGSAWAGPLLFLSGVALIGFFGYLLVTQLVFGHPVGGRPAPDSVLALLGGMMILIGVALLLLSLGGKLVTEVRSDALYVQHYPLTRRHCFPYGEIASCEARTYRPIREYGGWGVRYGLGGRGKAYNVSGNEGVQLVFASGKRLLIGSKRAGEVAQAIVKAKAGSA